MNQFPIILSYADIAAKGPKQSPEEAVPAPLPSVIPTSGDTHNLIDVDSPAVRTVPNDFLERDVQTSTQAARLAREAEAQEAAAAGSASAAAKKNKAPAAATARDHARSGGDGPSYGSVILGSGGLVLANVVLVLSVSAAAQYFGVQGARWAPTWKNAGLGVGVAAVLAVGESMLAQ
ncbi:hypothetical protein BROUX41_004754 [Berkeleyomyces rouxiae]